MKEGNMALDFYDSNGRPYAYSDDEATIYTYAGNPIAYLSGDSVYSLSGNHLGFFENGHIWDHSGAAVLFTDDASGGPLKPLKAIKPLKGLKSLLPLKGLKELKPLRAIKGLGWSSSPPEQIFGT